MIAASGMNKIDGGTRYARKIAAPAGFAPWNLSRSIAYAASTEATSDRIVDVTDTSTVFHSHSGYAVSNSSLWKCANVGLMIQNGLPVRASNSSFGLNEVTTIQ